MTLAVVYCAFALGIFGWQAIARPTVVLVGTALGAAVITVLAAASTAMSLLSSITCGYTAPNGSHK